MAVAVETKRQNFNITPEQEAEITALQAELSATSVKETILKAVSLARLLTREIKEGKRIRLVDRRDGTVTEVILPELEKVALPQWQYLVARSHSWKKQLFVKGRKLTAAQVWRDMQVNQMSEVDAMENWDLSREALAEVISYCKQNRDLLRAEADEERFQLLQHGVKLSQ